MKLWDKLLSAGKTVRAIGNSDAHLPEAVGSVWTALLTKTVNEKSILKTLWAGHQYVSDGPALDFRCGNKRMGDRVVLRGKALRFKLAAADGVGLRQVRLIGRDGKIVKCWPMAGEPFFKTTHLQTKLSRRSLYFHLEVESSDARRAFSNPIYISPAQ